MQSYIVEEAGQRLIFLEGEKTRMRVANEKVISNMNNGSLKIYRTKIMVWSDRVHTHGTPEAIRTIDYLKNTVHREYNARKRLAEAVE